MARYQVTDKAARLEINDKVRVTGDVLEESDFRPATGAQYTDWVPSEENPDKFVEVTKDVPGELDSLLASGHVVEIA